MPDTAKNNPSNTIHKPIWDKTLATPNSNTLTVVLPHPIANAERLKICVLTYDSWPIKTSFQ